MTTKPMPAETLKALKDSILYFEIEAKETGWSGAKRMFKNRAKALRTLLPEGEDGG